VDKGHDSESDTTILKRLAPGFAWLPRAFRERLTPGALWGGIIAIAVAVAYVVHAQVAINGLQDSVVESKKSVAGLQTQLDLLHKIDTQLQVMSNKVDAIATEVERQREWRDRIESVAELPPHPRKR
jgi:uncharacterized coiled-coil protein SlyX